MEFSKRYYEQRSEYDREKGKFKYVHSMLLHSEIRELYDRMLTSNPRTYLDFGCNNDRFYTRYYENGFDHERYPNVEITLYEPGIKELSSFPTGQFDMVVCSHVLEHIPMEDVGLSIRQLSNYTKKVLFIAVSSVGGKLARPDEYGLIRHCTVLSPKEWEDLIRENVSDDILVAVSFEHADLTFSNLIF